MYQTVGSEVVDGVAQCLGLPLFKRYLILKFQKRTISKKPINLEMKYQETDNDEVEDLFLLLKEAKEKYPELEGVSSGAIMSTYQKLRVENLYNIK